MNPFKFLLRDSLVYSLSALISKGVHFLLIPLYTHYLAPKVLGVYEILMVLSSVLGILCVLEIGQALGRFYQEATNPNKLKISNNALLVTVIGFSVVTVGLISLSDLISVILFGTKIHADLIEILAISMTVQGLVQMILNQLRWELRVRSYAILNMIQGIMSGISIFVCLHFLENSVKSIFLGQIVGGLFALLPAVIITRKSFSFEIDRVILKEMLFFSLPLIPASLSAYFALYLDRIMIQSFLSSEQLGIYGIAFRITSVVSLAMVGIQSALTPLVYKEYENPETPDKLASILVKFSGLACIVTFFFYLFAEDILRLLTTSDYIAASNILWIFCLTFVVKDLYIFFPGLFIAKKTMIIAGINLLVIVLNFIFNYLSIPIFGIEGAAYSTLVSSCILIALYWCLGERHYPVPHQFSKLLCLISVCLVVSFAYLHLSDYADLVWIVQLLAKLFVLSLLSVILWFSLGRHRK